MKQSGRSVKMVSGRHMSPRSVVRILDEYTSEYGPAPLIAELSRTRRQGTLVAAAAGFLLGSVVTVIAFALTAMA